MNELLNNDLNLISYIEYKKERSLEFYKKNSYYFRYYKRVTKRCADEISPSKKENRRFRENGRQKAKEDYFIKRIKRSFRSNNKFPIMKNIEDYDDIMIKYPNIGKGSRTKKCF